MGENRQVLNFSADSRSAAELLPQVGRGLKVTQICQLAVLQHSFYLGCGEEVPNIHTPETINVEFSWETSHCSAALQLCDWDKSLNLSELAFTDYTLVCFLSVFSCAFQELVRDQLCPMFSPQSLKTKVSCLGKVLFKPLFKEQFASLCLPKHPENNCSK